MKVNFNPLFDTEWQNLEKIYSEKDGVPVKYVITTSVPKKSYMADIFYRETPHPEFGNRYFGLHIKYDRIFIFSADEVEDLDFAMISDGNSYTYSRHRHDFVSHGGNFIDGGRDYYRSSCVPEVFRIKDGMFVKP